MSAPTDISLQRIVAQRLAGPAASDAHDVVSHLSAVQAQDLRAATDAVALRSRGAALADALAAGTVVRSWPMRGTLHLVTAADLPWMLALTGARQFTQAARRREGLGIDDATIERATELALARLADGPASRADLQEAWAPLGAAEKQGWTYHLIYTLAILGRIVQGPPHPAKAGEQLFTDLDAGDVTGPPDDALTLWAARYARSHGPVTAQDLARWTGLTVRACRAALVASTELADGQRTEQIDVEGTPMWRDPAIPDLLAAHRAAAEAEFFLPAFDELILGYADRTATLAPEDEPHVVPGKNGMFKPVHVVGGRAVGTWARAKGPASATPFPRA